jgi:hypothetical protein
VPELEEVSSETEVLSVVETETKAVFHIVEDVVEETESYEYEVIEEDHYQSESFAEIESQDEVAQEQEIEIIEEAQPDPIQEPSVETPKVQSTSRWAEVLFGSKDDEEDK